MLNFGLEITEEFDHAPGVPPVVSVCIGDLPSDGVKQALDYCKYVAFDFLSILS